MMCCNYEKLSDVIVNFSTRLKKGDRILIEAIDIPEPMIQALIRVVRAAGGIPFVNLIASKVQREMVRNGNEEQFRKTAELDLARMKEMQAYVAIRGSMNSFEMSDVPNDIMKTYGECTRPVLDYRVNKTNWVVLRWPSSSMAQGARMSTEAFEEFYFKVCTLDYGRMVPGMAALKKRMEATDRVHIAAPGVDLRFSIKGIPAIPCGGKHNIPDGEVFTAPVRNSVEGEILYNAPTIYQGTPFDQVRLVFKEGKIVEASCSSNQDRLDSILNSDEGARYVGEFALGFNPHIRHAMRDILFDEKISGSFHFTPGLAYEDADNGNRSQVHWDLVSIQRPDYGGGEIFFDDKLIRKDGLFVENELKMLNPEYLLG